MVGYHKLLNYFNLLGWSKPKVSLKWNMKLNMNKGKHEVTFLLLLIAHRLLRNITYIKSGGDFSQLSSEER